MANFFTADLHFGHRNIITYCNRPFASVEEMNRELIRRWNSIVLDSDTIFVLGDFSLTPRWVEQISPHLRGIKKLVPGNHDACFPWKGRSKKKEALYESFGWEVLPRELMFQLGDYRVLLNHMPYINTGDHESEAVERFPEYRPHDHGMWLLHGHVHTLWKFNERMINVGVDQWDYTPVAEYELLKAIENKT